ncbi:hypothetical protein PFISCL1PPCAC_8480, partial [Pristionchus fissidentatus]
IPIFVNTLNLILISFASPHFCMFIRISHKFNHRLIAAFCVPLTLLTLAASGFAYGYSWSTVLPINLLFWHRLCFGLTMFCVVFCAISYFILTILFPTLFVASITSSVILTFIEALVAKSRYHFSVKVHAVLFLLFSGIAGWVLSWSHLGWWLAGAATAVTIEFQCLLACVQRIWEEVTVVL